jgi:hypothetical protein
MNLLTTISNNFYGLKIFEIADLLAPIDSSESTQE